MKRITSLLIILILLLMMTACGAGGSTSGSTSSNAGSASNSSSRRITRTPSKTPEGYYYGDADGDGAVTVLDATRIQRHLAGLTPGISDQCMKSAMVTDGRELTILDATNVQRFLVNIISQFPVESIAGDNPTAGTAPDNPAADPGEKEATGMKMTINGTPVDAEWENNEAAAALYEAVREQPLTVQTTRYGGFEQVGALGMSLPQDDTQITTLPGDIILYAGNQMVVFYGSNTWDYTRLGRIVNMTPAELAELLSGSSVTIELTV